MVVRPDEIHDRVMRKEAAGLEALEGRIDSALEDRYDPRSGVTIDEDIMGEINPIARDSLLDRYRSAGWNVKYTPCQKDGSFYTFRKAVSASAYYNK